MCVQTPSFDAISLFLRPPAAANTMRARSATACGARLWQDQGRHRDACALLAPAFGSFTEGFETADLRATKALLDELT